jgi:hypothetical protein
MVASSALHDSLREAIKNHKQNWIAWLLALLAMTAAKAVSPEPS